MRATFFSGHDVQTAGKAPVNSPAQWRGRYSAQQHMRSSVLMCCDGRVGCTPDIGVLLTVGMHRLDHPKFYREVRRILQPGTGVFAAWTYSLPVLLATGTQEPGRPQASAARTDEGCVRCPTAAVVCRVPATTQHLAGLVTATVSICVVTCYLLMQTCCLQELLMQLYEGVLGPYWAPRRRLVEQGYRGKQGVHLWRTHHRT